MHHLHASRPATGGIIIHRAGLYNRVFGFILSHNDKKVVELAGIKPGDRVLDLGCGPGSLARQAKVAAGPGGEVFGLDASPEMIEVARREATRSGQAVNFQVGVIENLPFEDGSFDMVLSRLVIHHLPGRDLKLAGFREMRRVLKPGGLCLVVDFDPSSLPFLQKHPRLVPGLSPMFNIDIREYLPLMQEAGLDRVENGPTGTRLLCYVRGWKE